MALISASLNASFFRPLRLTTQQQYPVPYCTLRRVVKMKVTRDQIKARAQELRNQKFTIRATLEMNAGARPVNSPRNIRAGAAENANESKPDKNAPDLGNAA